jgi:cob(I)alamin adenosyltransferase
MDDLSILKELEPQIRVFRFETKEEQYADLTRDEQEQEESNIRNGINYVKKVLQTGECDLVVIDEILGLVDNHIIELQDIIRLIEAKDEDMELVLTGRNMPLGLTSYVSDVCEICAKKVTED